MNVYSIPPSFKQKLGQLCDTIGIEPSRVQLGNRFGFPSGLVDPEGDQVLVDGRSVGGVWGVGCSEDKYLAQIEQKLRSAVGFGL